MKTLLWNCILSLSLLLILPSDGYSLPLCPTDQQQVYDNCFGKYKFSDDSDWAGDFYIGEFQDDEFIGVGGYFTPAGRYPAPCLLVSGLSSDPKARGHPAIRAASSLCGSAPSVNGKGCLARAKD